MFARRSRRQDRARARHTRLAIAVALCAAAAWGCSDRDDQRRELLKPVDGPAQVQEELRKRRVFDDEGELIPSDQNVAGVVLPKGLTLHREYDHRWFYRTNQIPAEKLVQFFSKQLMSTTVERKDGSVTFGLAVPVSNLKAPRITLQVTALRGSPTASEVFIRQEVPPPVMGTPSEVEAQLRAKRARAD